MAQQGAAWLSRVQYGSAGCSGVQLRCSVAQQGAVWLSRVQRGSVGYSVAQQGPVWLSRVQRGSVGCSVAKQVKIQLGSPGRFFPLSKQAMETKDEGLGEWRLMNECTV